MGAPGSTWAGASGVSAGRGWLLAPAGTAAQPSLSLPSPGSVQKVRGEQENTQAHRAGGGQEPVAWVLGAGLPLQGAGTVLAKGAGLGGAGGHLRGAPSPGGCC